ncbi:MAG: leucine-rich repeat domain-containing protein [Sedimentisphaerales bacterium]
MKMKNLIIFLIICILVNIGIAEGEETVHFESSKLEKIVCRELHENPPLSESKMRELTFLHLDEVAGVNDLTGIEYATSLKALHIYDNPIRDLSPLSNLKMLKGIQLSGKYIEDISPLATLTNLEWLYLSEAPITDISPLAGLQKLESLSLTKNRISDISPLSKLINLKKLTIIYNQIYDISAMSTLTNLESLTVHTNHISDISALSGLSSLRRLDLSWNQISDVSPLVHLTNLTFLTIYGNPLNEEACDIHFPKMMADNPNLGLMTGRNLHTSTPKPQFKFYLGTLFTLALFGLLVIVFSKKTVIVKCNNISGNLEIKDDTNLVRRISTSALESLGFAVSSIILVGICIFIRYAVDVFPVGQSQMGGMSLLAMSYFVFLSALGSCIAALVIGMYSLFEIKRSNGLLIGNKQAYCGVLLSLIALVFCFI